MTDSYGKFGEKDLIVRDHLAIERTVLANERTVLAYFRTGLALVITGAGLIRFFNGAGSFAAGCLLVLSGVAVSMWGWVRWRKVKKSIARIRDNERINLS